MSVLSDRDIKDAYNRGSISINPWNVDQVQPASYDVRLGDQFILHHETNALLDPLNIWDNTYWVKKMHRVEPNGHYVIGSHSFVLGVTQERFKFNNTTVGRLEGKSSLGRLGLCIHATAGFFDPGFEGTATLELFNMAPYPIKLTPGMLIAQMSFHRTTSTVEVPYGAIGRYQGQTLPTVSKGVS